MAALIYPITDGVHSRSIHMKSTQSGARSRLSVRNGFDRISRITATGFQDADDVPISNPLASGSSSIWLNGTNQGGALWSHVVSLKTSWLEANTTLIEDTLRDS